MCNSRCNNSSNYDRGNRCCRNGERIMVNQNRCNTENRNRCSCVNTYRPSCGNHSNNCGCRPSCEEHRPCHRCEDRCREQFQRCVRSCRMNDKDTSYDYEDTSFDYDD